GRLEHADRAAERAARVAQADAHARAAHRVVRVVARIEVIRRSDRGGRELEIGDRRHRNVAVRIGRLDGLVDAVRALVAVDQRKAVEAAQAIAVSDRAALAALLVAEGLRQDRLAVIERDAEAVRRIHEPGIGVGDVEVIRALTALVAEGEVLALAQEVARGELRLHEEPAALGVTAAELNVVLPFLDALDGDVHGLGVGVDLEVRILRDLEVAELTEFVEALLEGLHVHDVTFLEEDLTAKHLVFGGGVALELQASEAELLALEDVQIH